MEYGLDSAVDEVAMDVVPVMFGSCQKPTMKRKEGRVRIDVHAHLWTEEYLDLLVRYGRASADEHRGLGAGETERDLDSRFSMMDAAGIDLQVLSASPQLPTLEDEDEAVEAARHINDLYARVVAAHPDRFAAFVNLPLPHVDAALEELRRGLDDLGMLGAAVLTSTLGRSIADPGWDRLYEELNRRASVLYVHPAGCGAGSPLISPYNLTWMLGAPIEDSVAAAHLITAGIPSRYPNMKIINSHLGGALPMLIQRMDNQYAWQVPDTPEPPSIAARRMWYDTVSHAHPPALRCACESFGADRLVLGTDFPYESGDLFQKAVDHVVQSGLPETDASAILDGNASELLASA
jgi:aminocarboxymuconate-semialdehyde decarboxylase